MSEPAIVSSSRATHQRWHGARTTPFPRLAEHGEAAVREGWAKRPVSVDATFASRSQSALEASLRWSSDLLRVSQSHDASEREADPVADSVVRSISATDMPIGGAPTATPTDGSLDADSRRRFEPYFGDLSEVRIHTSRSAAESAHDLRANAFTVGKDIWFGNAKYAPTSARGLRLIAHELSHVKSPVIDEGILHRDLDTNLANGTPSQTLPSIPRGTRRAVSSADIDQIRNAMDSDPTRGNLAALQLLREYEPDDTIDMLVELDGEHRVERIAGEIRMGDSDPVVGVIAAVLYLSPNQRATPSWGILAAHVVAGLPEGQRMPLLEHILRASGRADEIPALREGTAALEQSEAQRASAPVREVDSATAAAAPPSLAGVLPGPWNPPGRQPIPFYIGTSAHVAIAAMYASLHATDAAFYNVSAISTIIAAARRLPGLSLGGNSATREQLAMEPDIANLTRLHLYEIKPSSLQSLGRSEAALYVAAFAAAGLPIALGGITEPGTSGVIPAPGGWYEFRAPEPGVITYNYTQPPRVRVRVPVPEGEPESARESDKSLRERISEITGLTGAALTFYLIISEGSRLFPPRNLVPVP